MDTTNVQIDTEVEAYPVLVIREADAGRRAYEIPTALLDELAAAQDAVEQAELAIMRYVAERHADEDIHEWLDGR